MKDDAEVAFIKRELLALKKKLEQETQEKEKYRPRSEKLRRTLKYFKRQTTRSSA
jgi:hypothetical protein